MIKNIFRRSTHMGCVDGLIDGHLCGWAHSNSAPSAVEVDIWIDHNKVFESVVCDEFRQDLKDSKIGTGNAGFRLELPVELVGNDIPVELFIAGGKTLIASAKISIIQEEQMIETPETPIEPQEPIKVEEPVKIEKPVETKPKTPAAKSKPAPKKPAPKPAEYKGRLEIASANEVRGWVVNLNDKGSVFDVDVLVGGVYYASVRNDTERSDLRRVGMSNGRGGVSVTFPKGLFSGGTVEVALRLPSGELLNKSVESTQPVSPIWPAKAKQETPVSIVVPIYNALEDVEICLENLLAYTTQDARLILINDASPDPEIAKLLKTYSKHSNIEVLTNKKNMGFTRTVNRGIKEAGTDDVIFLNSDARVTPKWLEGLRAAVASDPRIATVTPLSDRAGAFSAPNIGNNNKLPFGVTEPEYARLVRRESLRVYPTVPTGNGFCMYVRRACIDEVGPLDEKAFPRGYGEENDFCMRARALGWRNIIDDATYVYHERSKSFGSDKTELMEAGRAVVDERHPDYKHAIKVYGQGSQVLLSRYRARRAMHRCIDDQSASRSRVLFVTSTATGGTPQTNLDLMRALSGDWDAWMLRCDSHQLILSRLVDGVLKPVKSHTLEEPVSPTIHTSFEYDNVVSTWLAENDFDLVHIRQLIWHSISLPRIAKEAGAVVINSFHDYYTICPSTKMLDVDGKFHESVCEHPKGFEVSDLWPAGSLPDLTEDWMSIWRKRFTDALEICDAFVTTSPSARDRIAQFMPKEMADKFVVIPHGRDFQRFHQSSQWPDPDEKFRILVPGNINRAKGSGVIEALLERDKDAQRLEFHILGAHDFETKHPGLVFHGTYKREEFAERAARISPHVGAVFSIWDETYCHTLTEMWAIGLPVIGLDYPTVATRIRKSGAGWVHDESDLDALYASMIAELGDPEEFTEKLMAVVAWQRTEGRSNTTKAMASKYQALYQNTFASVKNAQVPFAAPNKKPKMVALEKRRVAVVSPADPKLTGAPASTHVRVWERCINKLDSNVTYIRMTPDALVSAVRTGEISTGIIQRNALNKQIWEKLKPHVDAGDFKYTVDLDDDLMAVPSDKDPNGAYAAYALVLKEILEGASLVTVSTEPLAKKIGEINSSVSVVPNRLSGRVWRGRLPDRKNDGLVRGLYMGNRSHDEDFAMVFDAFESIASSNPNLRLRLIGALANPPAKLPKWLEIVDVPNGVQNYPNFVNWLQSQCNELDFGIAPLTNAPFNSYKSNLKALDYSGLGLRVLASKHSVYEPLKDAPHLKLVASTKLAWENALKAVIKQGTLTTQERENAQDWVSDHMLDETLNEYSDLVLNSFLETNK